MTERERSVRILAKSLVRDLTSQGYATCDIVNLATHLLDQVTQGQVTQGQITQGQVTQVGAKHSAKTARTG